MSKRLIWIVLVLAIIAAGAYVGIRNAKYFGWTTRPQTTPGEIPAIEFVVAQGRLTPAGGIVSIPAPPGQRIDSILVNEGDPVTAGSTELARLAGRDLLELQVQMATAKTSDAQLEIEQKIVAAEINLRAAEAARETARLQLEQVRSRADQIIAEKQIEAARRKLERMQQLADDPQTKNLISQQEIDDQKILLEKADNDRRQGDIALRNAIESAELMVKNADLNVQSATRSFELANQLRNGNQSLALAESIAQAQLNGSKLIAPISGTVLKIFVRPGEASVNAPLMQLGDLTKMECVAEVNDRIVSQVHVGQRALIKSPALPRDLAGTVRRIGRIVGNGTLANPSPLAMVDTKTVDVRIEIDANDAAAAAAFVHLQATVEIDPRTAPTGPETPVAQSGDPR